MLQDRPTMDEMIALLCELMSEKKSRLLTRVKGKQGKAPNRSFAMYACHYYCQETHRSIAKYFGLMHAGSVCYPIAKTKKEIVEERWCELVSVIEKRLYIV